MKIITAERVMIFITITVPLLIVHILLNMNRWISMVTSTAMVIYLATGGWRNIYIFWLTFPRDIRALMSLLSAKYFIYKCRRRNATVPIIFKDIVKKHPNKVAIYYNDREWTFNHLDKFSNCVANCFTEMGFHPGEEIALYMNSKPEFVGIWLGLAKMGIVTAFINTNQRLDTLVHSIASVNCKAIIYETALLHPIADIVPLLKDKSIPIRFFSFSDTEDDIHVPDRIVPSQSLNQLMKDSSNDDPINLYKGNFADKLYYIYTSGTTGLPKAVVIRHHRYFWLGSIVRKMLRFRSNDIFYLSLPLYHNNAGTIGTSQSLLFGNSIAVREKFSARNFWDDCAKYKCTGAMYIGEICRYLLSQPQKPIDHQHGVRIMFGNGLRPKIWHDFATRFGIKQIGEFYGATEGNANTANIDNKEGSCGFLPQCIGRFSRLFYPVSIIKVNDDGEPIRDDSGYCVHAKPWETGEIVGTIIESDPSRAFTGYMSEEASKKKLLRDVFRKGDSAFLSGDLMMMDQFGYLYFKDRTGDTYRWKGENVSTNEVEAVIQKITKLSDCVVFGVEVCHCEGKAGMAVIATDAHTFDFPHFVSSLQQSLPSFAMPIFIRFVSSIDVTGSFKLAKTNVQKQGFNPNHITDVIYFFDRKSNSYINLDSNLYEKIQSGEISL